MTLLLSCYRREKTSPHSKYQNSNLSHTSMGVKPLHLFLQLFSSFTWKFDKLISSDPLILTGVERRGLEMIKCDDWWPDKWEGGASIKDIKMISDNDVTRDVQTPVLRLQITTFSALSLSEMKANLNNRIISLYTVWRISIAAVL